MKAKSQVFILALGSCFVSQNPLLAQTEPKAMGRYERLLDLDSDGKCLNQCRKEFVCGSPESCGQCCEREGENCQLRR
jgi:hypothetical protein